MSFLIYVSQLFKVNRNFIWCLTILLFTSCYKYPSPEVDFIIKTAKTREFITQDFDNIEFINDKNLDLGFYKGRVFIKLEILNKKKPTSVIILCNDLINRNYRFYKLDNKEKSYRLIHDNIDSNNYDHRTYNFSKPNFRITLNTNEKSTYIISTLSDGRILQATPRLISDREFQSIRQQELVFDVIFYGAIIILLLINFFYSRMIKNDIYYFYVLYILFSCLMYLFVEGRLYGLGLSHHLIDHLMFLSIRLWIITSVLFAVRFLETKTTNPKFYRFIIIILFISVFIPTLYQLTFYNSSISHLHVTENLIGFMWIVLVFVTIILGLKKRKEKSVYYLISYSLLLIFIGLGLVDSHTTILPGDPFSYFKIGTIFEFAGFTYFIAVLVNKKLISREILELELMNKQKELEQKNKQLANNVDFVSVFKLLENSLERESDWEQFKVKFKELNPDFLNKLNTNHPSLTKSEIRLLTLIKIGYSQKEIADILNIAPDSVKKSRSRVRKKLNLPKDDKLTDYLDTL